MGAIGRKKIYLTFAEKELRREGGDDYAADDPQEDKLRMAEAAALQKRMEDDMREAEAIRKEEEILDRAQNTQDSRRGATAT
ncbi:hypothetical protein L5515_009624 [Caenorhabditis briggsae]|uniref:Uncharacterized protein n=1 Tax=Caenorhabditis briggsae TaxID=6238 RepID=A0AAE9JP63_CAEBR|nr:hypothetical protein L5515_009624 [Caenorhabditis briggsae]